MTKVVVYRNPSSTSFLTNSIFEIDGFANFAIGVQNHRPFQFCHLTSSQPGSDGSNLWQRMPDDEFRVRAAVYWLAQEFSNHLREVREEEKDPDARAALERKWLLVFAASIVFKFAYADGSWKQQIRKLYKGDWKIDDGKKGAVVAKIFQAAKVGLVMAYKNSKKFNPNNFVHRNWMRSKDTPSEIADLLQSGILPIMPDIGDIPN